MIYTVTFFFDGENRPTIQNSTHPANPLFRKRKLDIRKVLDPMEIDCKLDAMNICDELDKMFKG